MAQSRRELILQDIETALREITHANSYSIDLLSVKRAPVEVLEEDILPVAGIFEDKETVERVSWDISNIVKCSLPITIEAWQEAVENFSEIANKFLADIQKAILTDATRSGYANETIETSNEVYIAQAEGGPIYVGLTVNFLIIYYRTEGDPYS